MSGANGQRKVKGGSMGLAAAIQQQKSQGGGLQELRKSLSSKDSRAAKSQSVYVGSYPSVPQMSRGRSVTDDSTPRRPNGDIVVGTPPTLHRPVSMTYAVDDPPPKPPRTGSTSPSAFLSLGRDESLQWEEEKEEPREEEEWEILEGGWGPGHEEEEVWHEDAKANGRDFCTEDRTSTLEGEDLGELEKTVEEEVSPGKVKKPLLPPTRAKQSSSCTSDTCLDPTPLSSSSSTSEVTPSQSPFVGRKDSEEKGVYPRVPLLPPSGGASPSHNRATPSAMPPSSSSKKSPLIPKASQPSKSSPVTTPRTDSSSSSPSKAHSNSTSSSNSSEPTQLNEERLKKENEILKQQLLLLQSKLKSGAMGGNTSEGLDLLMELDNPLTAEGDNEGEGVSSRPRSRSVSPGDEEPRWDIDNSAKHAVKVKPTPQPRTRAQTVVVGCDSRKKDHPLPYSNKSSIGFTTPGETSSRAPPKSSVAASSSVLSSSTPRTSDSPIPKPRSGATSSKLTSSTVTAVEASRAEPQQDSEGGRGSRGEGKVDSALVSDKEKRSDSAGSSHSSSSGEKVQAALTLQKLLPRNSKMSQVVATPRQGSVDSTSQPPKKTSSHAVQSAPSPSSSSPKPIPAQRAGQQQPAATTAIAATPTPSSSTQPHPSLSSTAPYQQERPSSAVSTTASATTMSPTSLSREQVQATAMPHSAPYSSSVPSTSFLPQTGSTPGASSSSKSPNLKPAGGKRVYSGGKTVYKKVTLDDASWIKRKASLESPTGEAPKNPDSKTSSYTHQTSLSSSSSEETKPLVSTPPKPSTPTPLPYRSHPILPTSKPVSQPFITPSSPNIQRRSEVPEKPLPPRPVEPPKKETPPSPTAKSKKRFWGRKNDESKDGKKDKKENKKGKSGSNEELPRAPATPSEGTGDKEGKKTSKKSSFSQSQLVESPAKATPPNRPLLPKKVSPLDRPVSMMVNTDGRPEFTASATVSMPRGVQPEDAYKQQKSSRGQSSARLELIDEDPVEQEAVSVQQKKGMFGKRGVKSKTASAIQKSEEMEASGGGPETREASDSGSDDEKGGTIKKMPKLRHVSVKRPDMAEDEGEPEYHQLFEYVFVVSLKEDSKKKLVTETTYTFPPNCTFKGKDSALQAIPQFCYPDIDQWKPTTTYRSESFSFVLTDMEGNRRFGYCRRLLPDGEGPRLPEVYCIISPLGCFSLYENILDHVEERRKHNSLSVFNFLKAISANPFPRPGKSVTVKVFGTKGSGMEPVTFTRPLDSRLEHVDFSILFSTLSHRKIIKMFSSLLMERRVIFCASSLSLMTGCAHALMALLYPFEWQHVFIPVLPSSLIDFVCSPLPYIIGINPTSCQRLDQMDMEEAVVINLDKSKFIKQIGDEGSILPSKLFQFLEGRLGAPVISTEYSKKAAAKKVSNTSKADELVVNTFMTFFAFLYGDYRENLKDTTSGHKEFQRSEHIKRFKSKSTRRFLEAFQMTQMFEGFIEMRELPSKAEALDASLFEQKLPDLKARCQDIEIFSSKSRFDRWKMKRDLAKGD